MFKERRIYLDFAATTPTDKKVVRAMKPYWYKTFGNSWLTHTDGQMAERAISTAKDWVANLLGCERDEIYFTSGATESDNWAIRGAVQAVGEKTSHIVTTSIEHDAVLSTCAQLERNNEVEVTLIKPNSDGVISVDDVLKNIKDSTVIVSVMYVNNETGVVQPVRMLGKAIRKLNKDRLSTGLSKIIFHIDAAQAVNYFDCRADYLKADLISISAHKIYGPKGIGALYIRKDTPISPLIFGGEQQNNKRAGTLPTPLICGFGEAVELISKSPRDDLKEDLIGPIRGKKIIELKKTFIELLQRNIPEVKVNGSVTFCSPAHINFRLPGADNTVITTALDLAGISVSAGAACVSGGVKLSHVLTSMGLSEIETKESIRVSLGRSTTLKEIKKAVTEIVKAYSRAVEK